MQQERNKLYTAEEVLNLQSAAYQKGYNKGYQLRKDENPGEERQVTFLYYVMANYDWQPGSQCWIDKATGRKSYNNGQLYNEYQKQNNHA